MSTPAVLFTYNFVDSELLLFRLLVESDKIPREEGVEVEEEVGGERREITGGVLTEECWRGVGQ